MVNRSSNSEFVRQKRSRPAETICRSESDRDSKSKRHARKAAKSLSQSKLHNVPASLTEEPYVVLGETVGQSESPSKTRNQEAVTPSRRIEKTPSLAQLYREFCEFRTKMEADILQIHEAIADVKATLRITQKGVERNLKEVAGQFAQIANEMHQLPLPIIHLDGLLAVEERMLEDTFRNSMIDAFSSITGNSMKQLVGNMLTRLFTREMARTINYSGRDQKFAFRNSRLKGFVVEQVYARPKHQHLPMGDIERAIVAWLHCTRDKRIPYPTSKPSS